ncbi:LysR substrate-binding domain-containing protein [Holophaga foetida]|uniref:LysR substrate-binding domain-containing protein n=1 Tax=Holophaga foetida TaxID=35839 RepID=UPI00024746AA|nr:LysR substrate-binding domain-containing protein [Holophaga foetida]
MDRRQLKCFLAVGEHLHYTRAARAIGLSQSGVSYQLASIEASLGLTLMAKVGKGIHLSPAGSLLYRELRRICLEYARGVAECCGVPSGDEGLPDFPRLRCFLVAAKWRSFTKAAQEVCLTQSAFGYQIAELEKAVGCRLFDRSSRVVELSEAGYGFFRLAEPLLRDYEDLLRRCQCLAAQEGGQLTLGFLGGLEMRFLPQVLRRFSSAFPATQVQMRYTPLARMFEAILGGEIDCGFTMLFEHAHPEGIHVEPLAQDRMLAMVAPDHPLARRRSLRLEELHGQPLVSLGDEMSRPGVDWHRAIFARHGLDYGRAEFVPDFPSLLLAVEMGRGIAIQPRETTDQHGGGRLRAIELEDPELTFEYAMAWPTQGARPELQVLLELIRTGRS